MASKCIASKPCKNCPWKRKSKAGGENIPHFDIEMMRNLANTAPERGSQDGGLRQLFACHESEEDNPYVCAGYVARDGTHNVNLRLMAMRHEIPLQPIIDNAEKHDLYSNFHEMLDDYEKHYQPQSYTEKEHIVALLGFQKAHNYCALTKHIQKHYQDFSTTVLQVSLNLLPDQDDFFEKFSERLSGYFRVVNGLVERGFLTDHQLQVIAKMELTSNRD
ncbi:DUF6283 family protein [Vibrio sp. R78045]|uniref:DUF6283 family protein n=1 Tax=Vibrio sp. R78045 TaxID=3093868 RepID=UPI0036F3B85D